MSINGSKRGWGMHLHKIEIRFSDNLWQKETTNDIIWLGGKKCVIYRLDIIFSITYVSKINLFWQRDICSYPWRDIGREIPKLHTMPESWKKAMADFFYVTLGWDIWRNCSLCLYKCDKFQTWGAKMFLRKFYQI